MNHKKYLGLVSLLTIVILVACDPRVPGREFPDTNNPPPSNSGSERSVAQDPNAKYVEMSSGETIDMDFNGGAHEMHYTAHDNGGQVAHVFGQNVSQGSGIGLAPVSSIPTHADCKTITSWNPGPPAFNLDDFFCFETWDGNYGYLHVVKLKQEQINGVTIWTVGFNYEVWGP